MRGINCTIKNALLGGMVLVLSASPLLASGENKVENEKAKVEINKLEINKIDKSKIDKVMLGPLFSAEYHYLSRYDRFLRLPRAGCARWRWDT